MLIFEIKISVARCKISDMYYTHTMVWDFLKTDFTHISCSENKYAVLRKEALQTGILKNDS